MDIYFFDEKTVPSISDFFRLKDIERIRWDNDEDSEDNLVVRSTDVRKTARGATIFVHGSVAWWMDIARSNRETTFVLMSSDTPSRLFGLEKSAPSNVKICEYEAIAFAANERVSMLIEQLRSGANPDWSLLQRPRSSQWLVAAYIVLLARSHGLYLGDKGALRLPRLWDEVHEALGVQKSGVPRSWNEYNGLNDEKGVTSAVDEIRTSLRRSVA